MVSDIKGADFLALVVDDINEENSVVLICNRKHRAFLVLLNVVHPQVSPDILLPEYFSFISHIILPQLKVLIFI